jgi:hypothetical protein
MNNNFYFNQRESDPAPTIVPTITPTRIHPDRKDDPSRIPYKRPDADPRPKA